METRSRGFVLYNCLQNFFGENCYVLCSPEPMALFVLDYIQLEYHKEIIMPVNIFKIDFKTYFDIIHFFQFSDCYMMLNAHILLV